MEVNFNDDIVPVEIPKTTSKETKTAQKSKSEPVEEGNKLINCLRNEKIVVRFIPTQKGLVTDPKHVLYGGLGTNSKRRFVVPVLQSGIYKNILTNSEKDYLENIMGLPENSLSIYKKVDNFWTNKFVTLGKDPTTLDLSIPDDYIKYKILLSNDDFIALSEDELKNNRKATHQFVMIKEGDELEESIHSLNVTSKAYMLFGELKDNIKKLSAVIEMATGKILMNSDKKYVYAQVESTIKDSPEKFIKAVQDEYLDTKVLIKDAIATGYIRKRGHYYYLTEGNTPLCMDKQEPTLQSACEYLNAPKYQEVLLTLQSKVNK